MISGGAERTSSLKWVNSKTCKLLFSLTTSGSLSRELKAIGHKFFNGQSINGQKLNVAIAVTILKHRLCSNFVLSTL